MTTTPESPTPEHLTIKIPKRYLKWGLIGLGAVGVLVVGGILAFSVIGHRSPIKVVKEVARQAKNTTSSDPAVIAGQKYSNNTCSGSEIKKLSHLPMDAENITNVLPYGTTVGAHIMPTSHGYIWPGKMGDARDKYNVYAMADSTLFSISSRSINVDSGKPKQAEYQLNFAVSCVQYYYYDLITSLTPDLQKLLDAQKPESSFGNYVNVNVPIKAGQLVGKIGGQTLDYAAWDFNKTLTGIIVPEHYERDFPRIHLVDPFEYMTEDVKNVLVAKSVRSAAPVAGQVDYDVDGKLIGGWFQEGTKYYEGIEQGRYWAGHLAVVPNYIDPTFMEVSIGTYDSNNNFMQFGLSREAVNPRAVGTETGVVKYDLYQRDHTKADGSQWDRFTPLPGIKGKTNGPSQGCGVFQMLETRKLKAEFFPGRTCSGVAGFTSAAKIFTR